MTTMIRTPVLVQPAEVRVKLPVRNVAGMVVLLLIIPEMGRIILGMSVVLHVAVAVFFLNRMMARTVMAVLPMVLVRLHALLVEVPEVSTLIHICSNLLLTEPVPDL